MEPKLKALELVGKMCLNDCTDKNIEIAKKLSKIAVDEIIKALNDDIYIQGETDIDSHIDYYQEVKNEIEKL